MLSTMLYANVGAQFCLQANSFDHNGCLHTPAGKGEKGWNKGQGIRGVDRMIMMPFGPQTSLVLY